MFLNENKNKIKISMHVFNRPIRQVLMGNKYTYYTTSSIYLGQKNLQRNFKEQSSNTHYFGDDFV